MEKLMDMESFNIQMEDFMKGNLIKIASLV